MAQREPARVGDDGLDGKSRGAVVERFQQRRVDVQCDHLDAARREVERHAATGTCPDIEYGTAGLGGKLPPER